MLSGLVLSITLVFTAPAGYSAREHHQWVSYYGQTTCAEMIEFAQEWFARQRAVDLGYHLVASHYSCR